MAKSPPEATPLPEVGERLREGREALGLAQQDLANGTNGKVTQYQVSRFETGDRGLRADNLVALLQSANTLGISVDYVLTGRGSPVLVMTDDPGLIAELRRLVERHAQRGAGHGDSTDEPPGPGDRSDKP